MKLNEIAGMPKASNMNDLLLSIKRGKFTEDGSDLDVETFYCISADLTSLIGCPRKVKKTFNSGRNRLTSLEGCPQEVGSNFYIYKNKLTSLKDVHKHLKKMDGLFDAEDNPIKSHMLGLLKIPGCKKVLLDNVEVEEIINKYLPLGDILDCQEELIEAGFEEYAQL